MHEGQVVFLLSDQIRTAPACLPNSSNHPSETYAASIAVLAPQGRKLDDALSVIQPKLSSSMIKVRYPGALKEVKRLGQSDLAEDRSAASETKRMEGAPLTRHSTVLLCINSSTALGARPLTALGKGQPTSCFPETAAGQLRTMIAT
jgi:hypothetical protein